jgi:type IV secretory pathway protease TraF
MTITSISRGTLKAVALALTIAAAVACATTAAAARTDSTPVGPLPAGPTSTIATPRGELVAVALPHRTAGRVWRIARAVDTRVIRQVGEADVGTAVVLTFRATGKGTATLRFGLTKGETAKAFESRRVTVVVR